MSDEEEEHKVIGWGKVYYYDDPDRPHHSGLWVPVIWSETDEEGEHIRTHEPWSRQWEEKERWEDIPDQWAALMRNYHSVVQKAKAQLQGDYLEIDVERLERVTAELRANKRKRKAVEDAVAATSPTAATPVGRKRTTTLKQQRRGPLLQVEPLSPPVVPPPPSPPLTDQGRPHKPDARSRLRAQRVAAEAARQYGSKIIVFDLEWHDLSGGPISQIACVSLDGSIELNNYILHDRPLHHDWRAMVDLGQVSLAPWDDESRAHTFFVVLHDLLTRIHVGSVFLFYGTTDLAALQWSVANQIHEPDQRSKIDRLLLEKRPLFASASAWMTGLARRWSVPLTKTTLSDLYAAVFQREPPPPPQPDPVSLPPEIDTEMRAIESSNAMNVMYGVRHFARQAAVVVPVFHNAATDAMVLKQLLIAFAAASIVGAGDAKRSSAALDLVARRITSDTNVLSDALRSNQVDYHSPSAVSQLLWTELAQTTPPTSRLDAKKQVLSTVTAFERHMKADLVASQEQRFGTPGRRRKAGDGTALPGSSGSSSSSSSSIASGTTNTTSSGNSQLSMDMITDNHRAREEAWRRLPDKPIFYMREKAGGTDGEIVLHCKHCVSVLQSPLTWFNGNPRLKMGVNEIPSHPTPGLQNFVFCKLCRKYEGDKDDHDHEDEEEVHENFFQPGSSEIHEVSSLYTAAIDHEHEHGSQRNISEPTESEVVPLVSPPPSLSSLRPLTSVLDRPTPATATTATLLLLLATIPPLPPPPPQISHAALTPRRMRRPEQFLSHAGATSLQLLLLLLPT